MDIEKNLIENDCFAWLLNEYIRDYYFRDYNKAITNVIDWLDLCSGIEEVNITTGKYDEGLEYCSSARYYENSKSKLYSKTVTKLVQFHFAWGSLETLIEEFISQDKIEKYGKINALCNYFKKNNLSKYLPYGYVESYKKLIELLKVTSEYSNDLLKMNMNNEIKYNYKNYVDKSGIGIYVVYKIRNNFAHGTMKFSEPEEFSGDKNEESNIIKISTRIILMTIQMLLINDIKKNDFIYKEPPIIINDFYNMSHLDYLYKLTMKNNN